MNIDDLKDAWSQDEPKEMHLPVSTAQLGKTTSAVGKIRKNMRNEFIGVLVAYIALISLMFYSMQSSFFFNVTSIFVFTLIVMNGFYFFRFYVFYKSIGRYDFNVKDSIRKIAYDIELNTEIYKTYNMCVTPLGALFTFVLLCGKNGMDYVRRILASNFLVTSGNLLTVFAVILISFIITYVCINLHVRQQYGRYLTTLKQVVDDLGHEE